MSPSGPKRRSMGFGAEMDSQIRCKFVDLSSMTWQLNHLTWILRAEFSLCERPTDHPPQPHTTLDSSLTMPALSKLYLFAYNSLQAFGWAVSLFAILINFFSTHSLDGAYASAGDLICLLQTVSFLEVIHGALGIVPSGVLFPFMQWGGRTHFVLAIVRQIVEVQELPSVFITFVAWRIAEVIRYSHYALNCIGSCPSLITYLRYTVFIVLYPIGLAPGEMWTMYQALPFVKKKNLYADLFAAFPFSYYNFLRAVLICYPFLWLNLYRHLLKQRRSKLGRHQETKKKK